MKKVIAAMLLFSFFQISHANSAEGIRNLMEKHASLMNSGIIQLKDELTAGTLCPTRIDSIRPIVKVYYDRELDRLKINLKYLMKFSGTKDKDLENIKSKIESFMKGLKSLCFGIKLDTGRPFNGVQTDLVKHFLDLNYKNNNIPEEIGTTLDEATEIDVYVSSSDGKTVKCVSPLLGKEMFFSIEN
jgi:hypothetical protein